jgi:hypothetical protein
MHCWKSSAGIFVARPFSGQGFLPHLSLVYGSLSAIEKEVLASELRLPMSIELTLNARIIFSTEGEPRQWRRMGHFPIGRPLKQSSFFTSLYKVNVRLRSACCMELRRSNLMFIGHYAVASAPNGSGLGCLLAFCCSQQLGSISFGLSFCFSAGSEFMLIREIRLSLR